VTITAVIPVRKGSVRVKNKNIKPFSDSNLLEIKIKQLKKIDSLDRIVVSSDCQEMIKIAKELSVETHERKPFFASSEVNNSVFFKNLAEEIESTDIMYSPVTCPLISIETYLECIRKYKEQKINNLITVSPVKHHLWLEGKPINYEIDKSPNSQDLPDIYRITYGVSIIKRELMIKFANVVSDSPTFYVLDEIESMDIDTEYDFMVAEMLYKKINKD